MTCALLECIPNSIPDWTLLQTQGFLLGMRHSAVSAVVWYWIPIIGQGHTVRSHIHNFCVDVYTVISLVKNKMIGRLAV